MAELTEKQKRFADYYIESGNATEAYRRAYSGANDNTAAKEGHKLLNNPKVTQYVNARIGEKDKARIASQDEVLEFLTSLMRGEVTESVPILVGGGVQELVDTIPPAQVRKGAAELLGKRYLLWTEKHQIEGTVGVKIVDDL